MTNDLGQQMQTLYQQFGSTPGVTIELHNELIAIRVENGAATATVFLQGGQITDYQRKTDSQPILWSNPQRSTQQGVAIRGGIPICWPWFGARDKNPAAIQQQFSHLADTAHGFARDTTWQLTAVNRLNTDQTELLLRYQPQAQAADIELCLAISIGATLTVELTTDNRSDQPFTFSQALHSYFAIADIRQIRTEGFEQLHYIDALEQWQQHQQLQTLAIDREVDRIYLNTPPQLSIIDPLWQRRIQLNTEGSHSAILWNPWLDKGQRLSQFADRDYQHMLCIETANVLDDAISTLR